VNQNLAVTDCQIFAASRRSASVGVYDPGCRQGFLDQQWQQRKDACPRMPDTDTKRRIDTCRDIFKNA